MTGGLTSLIGMAVLIAGAMVAAQPQLHLAFEDRDDPRPRQFALSGQIMGMALGLVVSWSVETRQLLR